MSAEFITVLDPGAVTGMSNWSLDTDMPMRRLEYRLIKGGLEGFVSFMGVWLGRARPDLILCEKWDATGSDRDDASYSYKIEGALYTMADALGLEIEFVTRTSKLLATDAFLKEQGLYIFPKAAKVDPTIMHIDARDVNDTARLALGWAKGEAQHQPTIAAYWPDV